MNRTFEIADFNKAIEEKDYIKLKNYIVNSVRNNPGFRYTKSVASCSEATEAFNKLNAMKDDLPGLFVKYELQPGEIEFDENNKSVWNQEYFIRQTFLLGENFCSKRFDHVHRIGQYISKASKKNFNDPQEAIEGYENNNTIVETSSAKIVSNEIVENKPWPMIIAGIIAVVALLVGIVASKGWLTVIGILQ